MPYVDVFLSAVSLENIGRDFTQEETEICDLFNILKRNKCIAQ